MQYLEIRQSDVEYALKLIPDNSTALEQPQKAYFKELWHIEDKDELFRDDAYQYHFKCVQ